MKKIILTLIILLLLTFDVEAATNRLYFTEKDDRLYYDTDVFDKDIFMYHHDMVPGKEYVDELTIENKTNETYDLYLKVNSEAQDSLAEELIDNISMEVYLDGKLIYVGDARGVDYSNLQETILIGRYHPNKESKLIVKTKLSDNYTNTNNTSTGKITWEFYGRYGSDIKPILPETGDNISRYVILLSISSLIFILLVMVVYNNKNKNEE